MNLLIIGTYIVFVKRKGEILATLLAVFAHPDDESYGPAGTLATYARKGFRVALLTFTRGEAGSLGICATLPADEKADLRTREWECATQVLGVSWRKILAFPDGRLSEIATQKALQVLQDAIQEVQPQVILTFHPNGISGHPDHQVVSRWCWQLVQHNHFFQGRLFYYGVAPWQANMVHFRKLHAIPQNEITHVVDVGEMLEKKIRAIACHQSQLELWEKVKQVSGGFHAFARQEHFVQAWPKPLLQRTYDDLFYPETNER